MKKIVMFDTSYGTQNMGDFIINESINKQMDYLLNDNFVVRYSTHTPIQKWYQNFRKNPINSFCKNADLKFLCGTNIFKENLIHIWNDFNVDMFDQKCYQNVISLGCGMTKQNGLNYYSKRFYKKILNPNFIHSVRDDKTKDFLENIGFRAINTGCPTFWSLSKEHCKKIPRKKSNRVIFTLTDYDKDEEKDKILVDVLKKNYDEVFFWVQGSGDLDYLKSICKIDKIKIIGPNLNKYKQVLDEKNIDYVGTRLHAGVYAMQHLVRSIIIIIDNRARDIKKTYNIVSVERENIEHELSKLINEEIKTEININEKAIEEWKNQFIGGTK